MDIEGKTVTILGGKRSGTASARLVAKLHGKPKLSEQGDESVLPAPFLQWAQKNGVPLEFNGHSESFLDDSDYIILSPGVSVNSRWAVWARGKGIPVIGEVELAAQFCDKPIIAVTGSNGKTTVSTLISLVLEKAGYKTKLCGNVGYPFSAFVLDLKDIDYVVLEVSSFQLESIHKNSPETGIKGFHPRIAVILNFSQNHLDRHKDLEEYYEAKKRIALNQTGNDHLVLNAADPVCKEIGAQSKIKYFDGAGGAGNPNHAAVVAVAEILDIKQETCRQVFDDFKGVEHRLEKVRNIDGVDFINDSKATTAQAALWALNSIDRPVVMICGGRDKNIDFSFLAETIRQKVKRMYVIGEARDKIRKAFGELIALEECDGLQDAVRKARRSAVNGDCVLLSPMCTSFDMYSDFEERGRDFKKIVNQLS